MIDAPQPLMRSNLTIIATRLGATIMLTYFLFVLCRHVMPLVGDYAEWSYHGVLFRDVLQGHPDQAYVLKRYPVPNSLTTLGLGLLMLLLPWSIAVKAWLLIEASLGMGCAMRLQKVIRDRSAWQMVLLPSAVLFGAAFWFGFENFLFGVYFVMLLCSLLLREVESRWIFAVLLVLTFFSHMIPFGFALLLIALYAGQTRQFHLIWQTVPAIALTAWYFAGRLLNGDADGKAGMVASVAYATPAFVAFKINTYLKCWGFINPASSETDSVLLKVVGTKIFLLLFAADCLVAVTVLVLMWVAAKRAWHEKLLDRFFWLATAIFLAVGLVLPGAAAGISDPGGRMIQLAVWCAFLLVGTRSRWLGTVLLGCSILLLASDCYLLKAVAMQAPLSGTIGGPMPDRLRQFAHVYYTNRAGYYDAIEKGRMDLKIYPTAMFLQKDPGK